MKLIPAGIGIISCDTIKSPYLGGKAKKNHTVNIRSCCQTLTLLPTTLHKLCVE